MLNILKTSHLETKTAMLSILKTSHLEIQNKAKGGDQGKSTINIILEFDWSKTIGWKQSGGRGLKVLAGNVDHNLC